MNLIEPDQLVQKRFQKNLLVFELTAIEKSQVARGGGCNLAYIFLNGVILESLL